MSYSYSLWELENCNFLFITWKDILSFVTYVRYLLGMGELWRVGASIKICNHMKDANNAWFHGE